MTSPRPAVLLFRLLSPSNSRINPTRLPSSFVCPMAKNIDCIANRTRSSGPSRNAWLCSRAARLILKSNVSSSGGNCYVSGQDLTTIVHRHLVGLGDRTTVSETRLQRNFVVQVILHDQAVSSETMIPSLGQVMISDEPLNASYSTPNESPNSSVNE